MNRKLKKLVRDPSAFARDMVKNRVEDLRRLIPMPPPGRPCRRYSIVAAVYGVEKYLDEFFASIVRQTIGFERHIELILVDDGSLDGSAAIIAKWQKKYPRSIRYYRKENGGQASARNLGLEHATGDWVTFIDPDDFVDETYFERVDEFLARPDASDLALVSCNFIVYDEKTGKKKDTHPLRYRFTKGDRIVRDLSQSGDIQLTVNSALFRRDVLRRTRLRFDERIRPTFEDGHFVSHYLLTTGEQPVAFLESARYYYRKRADESSTIDRAWSQPSQFDEVLEHGCLDLFRRAEALSESGSVPVWLQRVVFYHLVWYFKRLVNNAEVVAFLSDEEKERFRRHLVALIARIDVKTILSFTLAGTWLYHKMGALALREGKPLSFQHVYIRDYDETKGLVQLQYFHRGEPGLEVFEIDGQEIFPVFAKTRRHDFLGDEFLRERIVWLSIRDLTGKLYARYGDRTTRIVSRGKFFHDGISRRELTRPRHSPPSAAALPARARMEYQLSQSAPVAALYRDAFLFMDRDTQADDNAEHLYRHVRATRPDINAFFVLRRTSHDWGRLKRDGFRLIAFGSAQHRLALLHAKHLISSHADPYVLAHPGGKELTRLVQSKFTFLQHGVISSDLSNWLNPKQIDRFITASPAEHLSIVGDGSYKFTEHEVVLTGLPRHDALGASAAPPDRIVAIMPTWRNSLVGAPKGASNDRHCNPEFFDSEYAHKWKALLHAPELRALAEKHGYRVQFFPHANIQPYLDWFAPPEPIETISHRGEQSIQDVFRSASILLTDYSSVAFEMAYLRRAIAYFHFERDFAFGSGHTQRKGYFDYRRDGFGPVCEDQESLLSSLAELMRSGGTPAPEHLERMDRTFAFRDGRACERTLEAILDLDRPTLFHDRSAELLVEAARSATELRAWERAEHRWERVLHGDPAHRPADAELRLAEAKRELGKFDEAALLLRSVDAQPELGAARAELATAAEDWQRALELWSAEAHAAGDERAWVRATVRMAEARRELGDPSGARTTLAALPDELENGEVRVERAEIASAEHRWGEALARWSSLAERRGAPEQSALRVAEALAALGRHEEALAATEAYVAAGSGKYERRARALRLGLLEGLPERAEPRPTDGQPGPLLRAVGISPAVAELS